MKQSKGKLQQMIKMTAMQTVGRKGRKVSWNENDPHSGTEDKEKAQMSKEVGREVCYRNYCYMKV